jgi:hypothetical protein
MIFKFKNAKLIKLCNVKIPHSKSKEYINMHPYEILSCKICDIPPYEICDECERGLCGNSNICSYNFKRYNDITNCVENYFVCVDCYSYISIKFKQVEINDDFDEVMYKIIINHLHADSK